MSSDLLRVTLEGAVLSAISNTLAQGFNVYRDRAWSSIDPVAFFHFIFLAIITTPPNYKWQMALERNFPSSYKKKDSAAARKKKDDDAPTPDEKDGGKETLSIANTLAKFVLDQTVGATLNTIWFIVMINFLRGATPSQILTTVQRDFFPMLFAGYKFWPLVTLTNLIVVPVERRMFVGGLAGLVWGIYISLTNM